MIDVAGSPVTGDGIVFFLLRSGFSPFTAVEDLALDDIRAKLYSNKFTGED